MSGTLDFAVVGLGEAGLGIHLPVLATVAGVRVAAVCDPRAEARAGARRWCDAAYEDPEEMLEAVRPDVVIVATPPRLHAAHGVAALEAGAHVVIEKPVASSLAEVDRIAAAARTAGRAVTVNHEFRMMRNVRAVLEAVAADGPVRFAQVWQLMDRPPGSETGWRGRLERRTLFEAGVHLVDLVGQLFGERPAGATASMDAAGGPARSDAIVVATLDFPGGRLAQVVQSRIHPGRTRYLELRADTATASYRVSHGGRARLIAGFEGRHPELRLELAASGTAWRERGGRRRRLAGGRRSPLRNATGAVLERAVVAFREGKEVPVTLEEARNGLAVIAACYRSAETGRRVDLDDEELIEMDLAEPLAF